VAGFGLVQVKTNIATRKEEQQKINQEVLAVPGILII
jgi:hypothetical protein